MDLHELSKVFFLNSHLQPQNIPTQIKLVRFPNFTLTGKEQLKQIKLVGFPNLTLTGTKLAYTN
jgi:hypothetical protein